MPDRDVQLTVVSPARDERASVAPLIDEIVAALDPLGIAYEIVVVDDGSHDGTREVLSRLLGRCAPLRVVRLSRASADRGLGISAALHAGFRAARGRVVATLDADGQNDPAELPRLLSLLERDGADLVIGDRSRARCDGVMRRASSGAARLVRRALLADRVRDSGSGLRVMRRQVALALPLHLRGMHRFIPYLARWMGYRVVETPVSHRPRTTGRSKHGIRNRAWPALVDCLAVRWMRRRRQPVEYVELGGTPQRPAAGSSANDVDARKEVTT